MYTDLHTLWIHLLTNYSNTCLLPSNIYAYNVQLMFSLYNTCTYSQECCVRSIQSLSLNLALTQLLSHLPSLHSLDLQSCLHLDHSSLLSLTSTSPYLTSLTLSGCHMVNDHCVIICSNRLKYLQALSLTKTKVRM